MMESTYFLIIKKLFLEYNGTNAINRESEQAMLIY